jgi:hypothetical protein
LVVAIHVNGLGSNHLLRASGLGLSSSMDWQQLVSLTIVAGAASALLGSKLRRRQFIFQRDTHCGCSSSASPVSQSSVVFRARKGKRPEVLVKMR